MRSILATLLLTTACGSPGMVEHPPDGALDSIAWLQGVWRTPAATDSTEEVWVPSGEHVWVGFNRTRHASETSHYELLRMEVFGDGVRYVAAPVGQARTAFALVRGSEREARFENPGHDFPRWIRYQRSGRALTATIGGEDPDEVTATWGFERSGDPPALVDDAGTMCRDGSRLDVTLSPCHCGAQIRCAAFPTDGGLDVHLVVLDQSCDACAEATGSCEIGSDPVVRVNGRRVDWGQGCLRASVSTLMLWDD